MPFMKSAIAMAVALGAISHPTYAAGPASAMTQARLLDRVAIEDLLSTYLYRLDHGQADTLAALYADDGVMDVENVGPLKGHSAIAAYYAKRSTTRTTRHVLTNLYVVFDDSDHAHTTHTLTYFMGEGAGPFPATPSGVADYANVVARGKDGRWVIQYRKPTPIFGFRPGAPAAPAAPAPAK